MDREQGNGDSGRYPQRKASQKRDLGPGRSKPSRARTWSVKREQSWLTQCHEVAEVAVVAANGRVGGPAAYEYGR